MKVIKKIDYLLATAPTNDIIKSTLGIEAATKTVVNDIFSYQVKLSIR